jgi:peptidoglycan hydrolase-like protein with peptidoglycan-binding domain
MRPAYTAAATTSSVLKNGSTSSAVSTLQTNLNKLGYSLTVDGEFGDATESAVKAF